LRYGVVNFRGKIGLLAGPMPDDTPKFEQPKEIAWTDDLNEAVRFAKLHLGVVVDADRFIELLNDGWDSECAVRRARIKGTGLRARWRCLEPQKPLDGPVGFRTTTKTA
jgi:hypothetical protein